MKYKVNEYINLKSQRKVPKWLLFTIHQFRDIKTQYYGIHYNNIYVFLKGEDFDMCT